MLRLLETLATVSVVLAVLLAFCGSAQAELPAWKCGADADCVNPSNPYCDLDTGDCYPCLLDEHCELDELCHQNFCIAKCFSDADCSAPMDHCNPEGLCRECLEDAHCPEAEPLCLTDEDAGACVECIIDEDCPEATPWCRPGFNSCVECVEQLDCPEDQHCAQGSCTPDICEPGARSCSDDKMWVLECDAFGSSELALEQCLDEDCEDGICGGAGGTGTGSDTGSDGGSDEVGTDTGAGVDTGAATPLSDRGCACSFGGRVGARGAPLGGASLILLLALGVRGRRARQLAGRSRARSRRCQAAMPPSRL